MINEEAYVSAASSQIIRETTLRQIARKNPKNIYTRRYGQYIGVDAQEHCRTLKYQCVNRYICLMTMHFSTKTKEPSIHATGLIILIVTTPNLASNALGAHF